MITRAAGPLVLAFAVARDTVSAAAPTSEPVLAAEGWHRGHSSCRLEEHRQRSAMWQGRERAPTSGLSALGRVPVALHRAEARGSADLPPRVRHPPAPV